jgi:hydrophobic/amphiphilic exporter-1 (mainly G- bacteria), HAE1 family
MSPALLSVRRPILISSIVILLLALGWISLKKLPIDLYPDVTFPTVMVQTTYSGAGPQEVESGISEIIEDEVSSISGVKKVSSQNLEGVSIVMVEFDLKQNLNFAEQQVRAKVTNSMRLLPEDVDAPVIRQISPSDAPIMTLAIKSTLPDAELYDLAKERIAPRFEQIPQMGQVDILGGRKREVHINLDRDRLIAADVPATTVAAALKSGGRNIPVGKTNSGSEEVTYRTVAEYKTLQDITQTVLRLASISNPITIQQLGSIEDTLQDEVTRTRLNGQKALTFSIYRQSGANSVRVADDTRSTMEKINAELKAAGTPAEMQVIFDMSKRIRDNVYDVYESIIFGVILTVIVVYFFLGSLKSTLITGFALPNSLLGACILMLAFSFSINIMSLLAMSLVVGLLVDDAIVVRENIFRKLEAGMSPKKAAVVGTDEVTLAVVATTLTILAVFGPIGNLEGIVGQFFKQFGLTVCFAMIVSLFDGLFVAPAMSAYVGGSPSHAEPRTQLGRLNKRMLKSFDRFQTRLEKSYARLLHSTLRRPWITLLTAVGVFVASLFIARFVPFTFISPADNGEFYVRFELAPGASLQATDEVSQKMEMLLKQNKQIKDIMVTVGSGRGESNKGNLFLKLVPAKTREESTSQIKELVTKQLSIFKENNVIVTDNPSEGGERGFNLNLVGQDLDQLVAYSKKVFDVVSRNPALQQADSSYRSGKPEYQLKLNPDMAMRSGVTITGIGGELRTLIEGQTPAVFREKGVDYDVRVRLREDQRSLKDTFSRIYVPNLTGRLVPLSNVAHLVEAQGPTSILRENRSRYIQISADMRPGGGGLGGAMSDLTKAFQTELKPPPGISYTFVGQAERFGELMRNILMALGLGVMFIYLVLASLYESFIKPFTIMLVIPLAACGAFAALFVMRSTFDLFSMIGCVMLMGLATKNSILLVDYAAEEIRKGKDKATAIIEAGETRLRPILMTSFALIAGMIPVAIGLNEASKTRTSLGIVVIGGTISSTLLTLVVIPAAYLYIDRFEMWAGRVYHRIFGEDTTVV